MATLTPDNRYMAAALRLSRWNTGQTSTNPSVACLIVRDGVIVGQAVTAPGGRPHAETQALAMAGDRARGATAYVTLEPCSHHGKTPPCVDALAAYGVARVVVGLVDPDVRVSGRGLEGLREGSIEVVTGILESDGERVLEAYLMRQRNKRPHVTLKLAVSADGMIGRKGQGQVRITGAVSRAQVQVLRSEMDAILIGVGTAIADDPELTCRLPGLESRSPVRIVLDNDLRLPLDGKLARTARDVPVIAVSGNHIASGSRADPSSERDAFQARREALETAGVEVLHCDLSRVEVLLAALATRGLSSLLVEGGATVAKSFLASHLVDRLQLFTGPDAIGGEGIASPVTASTVPSGFRLLRQDRFGGDVCDTYEREN